MMYYDISIDELSMVQRHTTQSDSLNLFEYFCMGLELQGRPEPFAKALFS